MSSKFEIKNSDSGWGVAGLICPILNLIPTPTTYTIENKDTGQTKEVTAWDRDELGKRISNGEFDDD